MVTKPIFHRGIGEENTMPAFRAAVARNRGFEFDVHPTKDATFAVIHDPTWTRTCKASTIPNTDPPDRVSAATQAQVDNVRTKGDNSIPSLRSALAASADLVGSPVLIDWKMADPWPDACYATLNQRVLDAGINKSFLFSSDRDEIAKIRTLAPDVRICFRPIADEKYTIDDVRAMEAQAIQPEFSYIGRDRIAFYQDNGFRVISQDRGINTKSDLDQVRNMGFDYVLIDADKWDQWT